jgi:phosphatidylcholine synthase
MWNLVVNVLFVLQSQRWVNVLVVSILIVFSFIPVKFIHPVRVRDFRKITIPVLVVWLGAMLYITWILDDRTKSCASHCLTAGPEAAQGIVYAGAAWIVGVGLWRTVRGRPSDHPAPMRERSSVSG